jgi:hypothetical protein
MINKVAILQFGQYIFANYTKTAEDENPTGVPMWYVAAIFVGLSLLWMLCQQEKEMHYIISISILTFAIVLAIIAMFVFYFSDEEEK